MTARRRVGVLGGTFDPVHEGHLAAARAAQQALSLQTIRFVPSGRPPHRPDNPRASGYDRLEMVRRAIQDAAGWEVSDLELRRDGPSFTFDTLTAMHAEGLSPLQIFFITGADAFAEVASWSRYPAVLDQAHFVVVTRPGFSLSALVERLPSLAARTIEAASVADFAAPRVILLPSNTPAVSSTEIRRRAARGESLEGWVPPAVAAYIAQHRLYHDAAAAGAAAGADGASDGPAGK